ncbi:MAG: glycerate kinase [Halorhodospira sp.]
MPAHATAPRQSLTHWLDAALAAASAERCVPPALPEPPAHGRTLVVGAGKAAAAMAAAVESAWPTPLSGTVIIPYGHAVSTEHIKVLEAGHPVPDSAGIAATERLLACLDGLEAQDLVLVLLSGGGSALLTAPAPPLALAEKQALTRELLRSGAPISAMNTLRRQLSVVKGGRLALRAYPARVITLLISDVPGDDPAMVASGPTAAATSTPETVLALLRRYGISCPASVEGALNHAEPPPQPGDPRLARVEHRVIASAQSALQAAAQAARAQGVTPLLLGDALEGEAREVGRIQAGIARSCQRWGTPCTPPCVLLSGGETSVTVRGGGQGGRNTELALAAALALEGAADEYYVLSADSDGIDGNTHSAGALVDPGTLARARDAGLDPHAHLDHNDSHSLFAATGDLLRTGPTLTNVNDFRALYLPSSIS